MIHLTPDEIERATRDPVRMVRDVFHAEPSDAQAEMLRRMDDPRVKRQAWKACRRAGKTAALSWIVIRWLLRKPYAKVPCTAPTQHQLNDLLWPELHKWIRIGQLEHVLRWSKTRVQHVADPNEWFAAAVVGRVHKEGAAGELGGEAFGVRGFHSPYTLVVIDEASGVADPVYTALEGSLSGGSAKMIAAGNPSVPMGQFYRAFHEDSGAWSTGSISYLESPMVSDAWGEEMISRFGKRNPIVRVEVLGQFPAGLKGGLIPLWAWEQAVGPDRHAQIAREDPVTTRVLGLDVARQGDNRTILAYAEGRRVTKLELIDEFRSDEIAAKVMARRTEFEPELIVVDTDGGYGAGVVDCLVKAGVPGVVAWSGGAATSQPNRFLNARAELGWAIKEGLEDGTIAMPDEPEECKGRMLSLEKMAAAQATQIKYRHTDKGQIRLETKKEMAERGLQSPDEFDAVCYALVPTTVARSIAGDLWVPDHCRDRASQPELTNRGRFGGQGRGRITKGMMVS